MSNDPLKLGSEFPEPDYQTWRSMVDKVLKGADFDKSLLTSTYDDLSIQPLYTDIKRHPTPPGEFPFTRSVTELGKTQNGWSVAQQYTHPDIKHCNQLILEDLNNGVSHIHLFLSQALSSIDLDSVPTVSHTGGGLECYAVDDLETLLQGVQHELITTDLHAGSGFYENACALIALWRQQGLNSQTVSAGFNADPAAALSESGSLPASTKEMLDRLAALATFCETHYPKVRAVGVDTSVYHNAGASHSQEIALALATAVAYLRAMTSATMDINAAARQIRFILSTDTDYFQCIAKLRCMRELWAQVCKECGADDSACKIDLHVRTSSRMISKKDPWVNILRATIAANAAAIGGAESVITSCFDRIPGEVACGDASRLGRRISRNTQLLLQEESYIHRVLDPAGGSWFIESHTGSLAEKAWQIFQAIEAKGGIFNSLENGFIQAQIAAVKEQRMQNLAHRQDALTGVSEYANLLENPISTDSVDIAAIRNEAADRLADTENQQILSVSDTEAIITALDEGTSTVAIARSLAGQKFRVDKLESERLATCFEALRDASDRYRDKHAQLPSVYVVTIGKPAEYNLRASFCRNLFAAGGIDCLSDNASTDSAEIAALDWKNSSSPIAVLCGADSSYSDHGSDYIRALRDAGAEHIYIVGKALEGEVDQQLFARCNALDILRITHRILEVE